MHTLDWTVVLVFITFVIWDGTRRRARGNAEEFLLAGRGVPWWAMGLSVMATQASAITMVGTTGMGFSSGTGFVQFYYFLPLAMLILALTAVPFFHRAKVFTAYEFLERRFGRGTRTATSLTFLIMRCLSLGGILSASALVLSAILQQPYYAMVLGMGAVAVTYTAVGGLRAVISTDVKQMGVMVCALVALFVVVVTHLPSEVGLVGGLRLADAAGRIELFNWSFDPKDKYTVWSALLGGTLLFLAYFGADQSQVQRYLAGRSLKDKRQALLLNAAVKVPFQLGILLLGVLLFVWTLFDPAPLVLHTQTAEAAGERLPDYARRNQLFEDASRAAGEAGRRWLATEAPADRRLFEQAIVDVDARRRDVGSALEEAKLGRSPDNDVIPWFMKHRLPPWGLAGLLFAGILAAALSSIDSELNSLSTVGVLDILRIDPEDPAEGPRIIRWTRTFTVLFGVLAAAFAFTLEGAPALVEVVNAVGSWFYGSLLGVFLLAWLDKRARGAGAVAGLVVGILTVVVLDQATDAAWLWRNTVGTGTTVVVGFLVSRVLPDGFRRGK
jgi:Na+/proline symporter